MKKILFALLLSIAPHFLFSQVRIDQNKIPHFKNEVGIELGWNGLLYSVYYQRSIVREESTQFNIKLGTGISPNFNFNEQSEPINLAMYIVPNILIFKKKHAWEIGIGFNYLIQFAKSDYFNYYNNQLEERNDNSSLYFITPQVGYRAYFKNSKLYFRTAASLFIVVGAHESGGGPVYVDPKVLPWAGFGFGYCFGKH